MKHLDVTDTGSPENLELISAFLAFHSHPPFQELDSTALQQNFEKYYPDTSYDQVRELTNNFAAQAQVFDPKSPFLQWSTATDASIQIHQDFAHKPKQKVTEMLKHHYRLAQAKSLPSLELYTLENRQKLVQEHTEQQNHIAQLPEQVLAFEDGAQLAMNRSQLAEVCRFFELSKDLNLQENQAVFKAHFPKTNYESLLALSNKYLQYYLQTAAVRGLDLSFKTQEDYQNYPTTAAKRLAFEAEAYLANHQNLQTTRLMGQGLAQGYTQKNNRNKQRIYQKHKLSIVRDAPRWSTVDQQALRSFMNTSVLTDWSYNQKGFEQLFPKYTHEDLIVKAHQYMHHNYIKHSRLPEPLEQLPDHYDDLELKEQLDLSFRYAYHKNESLSVDRVITQAYEKDIVKFALQTDNMNLIRASRYESLQPVLSLLPELDANEKNRFKIGFSDKVEKPSHILKSLALRMKQADMKDPYVFQPTFKHLIAQLADPKLSDAEKQTILFKQAEALGNCNTPVKDLLVKEAIMIPEQQRKVPTEIVKVLSEKIELEALLKQRFKQEDIALSEAEPIENINAFFNALYRTPQRNSPYNELLKITGGPELPMGFSAYPDAAFSQVTPEQAEVFLKMCCKTDEKEQPIKGRRGYYKYDADKIGILSYNAREATGQLTKLEQDFKEHLQEALLDSGIMEAVMGKELPKVMDIPVQNQAFQNEVTRQKLTPEQATQYLPIYMENYLSKQIAIAHQKLTADPMTLAVNSDTKLTPPIYEGGRGRNFIKTNQRRTIRSRSSSVRPAARSRESTRSRSATRR